MSAQANQGSISISGSGGVSVKIFTGDEDEYSFEDYKNRIKCVLELKDLEEVLEDTFTVPTTAATDEDKAKVKNDKKARTWFKLTTSGPPHHLIKELKTAKAMFSKLENEYDLGKEDYDQETLELMFNQLVLEDGQKPSVYFVRLEELNIKFEKFQKPGGKEYKKDARELIIKVSNSVGEEYGKVIETWKTKIDDSKTSEEKYNDLQKVLKEYYKTHFSKLTEIKGNIGKSNGLVFNMGLGGKPKCTYCGKPGHTESQCWKKNPELKPRPKNNNNNNNNRNGKKLGPCWICGGDHLKKNCPQRNNNNNNNGNGDNSAINGMFIGMVCTKCEPEIEENEIWIGNVESGADEEASQASRYLADSGSQTHAICDENIEFENKSQVNEKVQGFDGSSVIIKEKGDLTLRDLSTGSAVTLKGVRKSSAIRKNIISIGQLQSEGWILRGHDAILVLEKDGEILRFVKSDEENLYYMDAKVTSSKNVVINSANLGRDEGVIDPEMPVLDDGYDSDSSGDSMPPPLIMRDDSSDDETSDTDTDDEDSDDEDDYYLPSLLSKEQREKYEQAFRAKGEDPKPNSGGNEKEPNEKQSWAEIVKTPTGQTAVVMQAMTQSAPPVQQEATAIVSDSESDEEDTNEEVEEEVVPPKVVEEKKKVSFKEAETKHPKGILKTASEVKDAIAANDGNPIAVKKEAIDINVAHNQWGHHGIRRLKAMAKQYGFRLTGNLEPCDACGIAKASQTRISKTTNVVASRPGERFYVDTTGPFVDGPSRNKYLHGAVDDFSGKMFAQFSTSKKGMTSFTTDLIERCKGEKHGIKYIRMDGGGENEGIHKIAAKEGIVIEKTPPHTPQYNGRIERRFPVIISMAMAMIWAAGFTKEMKNKLLGEAITTAIFLHDMAPTARNDESAYKLWYGGSPRWKAHHLVEFGRVGIVKVKDKHVKKGEMKGVPMVMVGYAINAPVGTYRMFNPVTKRVITTDSVTWSHFNRWKIAGEIKGIYETAKGLNAAGLASFDEEGIMLGDDEDGDSEKSTPENTSASNATNTPTPNGTPTATRTPRASGHRMTTRSQTKLKVAMIEKKKPPKRPTMTDGKRKVTGDTRVKPIELDDGIMVIEEEKRGDKALVNSALFIFTTSLNSDPGEPKTDEEALNGPEKDWWFPSCVAEINNFLDRGSWKFVSRDMVKKMGRKLIATKMVYKKKDEPDGTIRYKSRCVSKGFMQIPGVDYTEKFSPVATDTSIRLVVALILFNWDSLGWRAKGIDIEAAFLEGLLDKKYYLEPPYILVLLGFLTEEEYRRVCIELQKGMYGQVDAALRFFIRFTKYLESDACDMVQSKADPCIFYKKDKEGNPIVIAAVTVDDCLIGGKPEDIETFMNDVEKEFNIVKEDTVRKHLGVDYEFYRDEYGDMCAKCTMDKKVKDIVKSYEEFIGAEAKVFQSPGAPNSVLDKNEGEVVDINEYRSFVGRIMFFSTKIGPKLSNAVRDLARHMSNPGDPHWKALGRAIGYMKGMTLNGIIMRKPETLRCVSLCDADFAKDPITRRSVGGEIHTLGGCLTAFSSRGEKSISNSTAESEYKSLSSGGREMKFQQMLLEEIAHVETPGILGEDNEGCEFLVKNKQVSSRTKHIDIAMHSIREFCSENDDGITRGTVMRVSSEENTSDICTKNVDVATFKYHEEEIDKGFPRLRQKVFGNGGFISKIENDQKLLGGMSSEDSVDEQTGSGT